MVSSIPQVANDHRIYMHESKNMPIQPPDSKIVPAYGLGKCPKLVSEVLSTNPVVRVAALRVLCAEFANPHVISGCVQAGIMDALPAMVIYDDLPTRVAASMALSIAARDYNGRTTLLSKNSKEKPAKRGGDDASQTQEGAFFKLLPSLDDESMDVRRNIYNTLKNASQVTDGTRTLVLAGYPARLVSQVTVEDDELKPLILQVLYNLIADSTGIKALLEHNCIQSLIELLNSPTPRVYTEAALTLGYICFNEMAKIMAIQCNGVAILAELIGDPNQQARAAALGALMTITSVDAGKRAILSTQAVDLTISCLHEGLGPQPNARAAAGVNNLLGSPRDLVILNALKLIASITAHPDIRFELKRHLTCLDVLTRLEASPFANGLIAKHAKIAKETVLWVP